MGKVGDGALSRENSRCKGPARRQWGETAGPKRGEGSSSAGGCVSGGGLLHSLASWSPGQFSHVRQAGPFPEGLKVGEPEP